MRTEQPEVLQALPAAGQPTAPSGTAAAKEVPACIAAGRRDEWEVTFLGTGAAVPSKYRNVTGIHVNLFDHGGLLLDCGEPAVVAGGWVEGVFVVKGKERGGESWSGV